MANLSRLLPIVVLGIGLVFIASRGQADSQQPPAGIGGGQGAVMHTGGTATIPTSTGAGQTIINLPSLPTWSDTGTTGNKTTATAVAPVSKKDTKTTLPITQTKTSPLGGEVIISPTPLIPKPVLVPADTPSGFTFAVVNDLMQSKQKQIITPSYLWNTANNFRGN